VSPDFPQPEVFSPQCGHASARPYTRPGQRVRGSLTPRRQTATRLAGRSETGPYRRLQAGIGACLCHRPFTTAPIATRRICRGEACLARCAVTAHRPLDRRMRLTLRFGGRPRSSGNRRHPPTGTARPGRYRYDSRTRRGKAGVRPGVRARATAFGRRIETATPGPRRSPVARSTCARSGCATGGRSRRLVVQTAS